MPRVVDRAERLDRIARAVRRVLQRDGVEQTTMRNVAAELGSTTGLITHWVPDRAGLLHLALRTTADEQSARATAALKRRPRDIANALDEYLLLDDARRDEMKVWFGFWALALSDARLQEEHRDRYRGFRSRFVDHLRGLGVAVNDARGATDHLMTTVDGIAVEAMFDPAYWTAARQRRHLREVIATVLPSLSG
jgi:TetR/AcrR family transcriptional regulator, transcriptional repressor of bet genes